MKKEVITLLPVVGCAILVNAVQAKQPDKKPNVIIILADDLGFGDISAYGATEIQTPNIDRIANEGVRFCDQYAEPFFPAHRTLSVERESSGVAGKCTPDHKRGYAYFTENV